MVYSSHAPSRGLSWALRLTLCMLLGIHGLSHPLPAQRQGQHRPIAWDTKEAALSLDRLNWTETDTSRELSSGLLPNPCRPVSSGCKNFLDRLHMFLLGKGFPQMQPLCTEDCDLGFFSCENDVACSPLWPPVLEKMLCAPGCTTYGQKFANGADLCGAVLGYTAQRMAPPGSQHCPDSSTPALPHQEPPETRGTSLALSSHGAPAWLWDPAGSGGGSSSSGSGSGH
ncbi:retbindin [Suncus etruscus]|uniref:retbindin n=1 Tax=Suncus etruscus TaxID=109475 RepID=UPI002110A8D4|nr:retbindin [Suncus etruscus]